MYKNYFNLNERPFRDSTNPNYIYLSDKHSEALASFKYALEHEKGFLVLTGEIGTGKTSIVKRFLKEIGDNSIISTLTNPDLELIDFFKIVADEFGLGVKIDSKADFLIAFKKFLHKAYENGKNVLLIIDEAHKLRQDVLDEIRMLSNIESPDYKMLNIFFVGQTEFNDLILKPQNYSLRQRISINYLLEPLSKDETVELIRYRIKCAGGNRKIFSAAALQSIHQYTSGYPRWIVTLCDGALISGYAKSVGFIKKDIIDECAKDQNIAGFELRGESNENSEKFSIIEFNTEKPHQKKPENIIDELRKEIKSQKYQKSVKTKKWQLSLACGILILLSSIGFYFIKGIIDKERAVSAEKQKKIGIAKIYSTDKNSQLDFNDSKQNVLKETKALISKEISSSDKIPSTSMKNNERSTSQKEMLPNTIKPKTKISFKTDEGGIQPNRKTDEGLGRKPVQEAQQVENISAGETTQIHKAVTLKSKSSDYKKESKKTKPVNANKIQSKITSAPNKNIAISKKKVSAPKVGKIEQVFEDKDKLLLAKKPKVDTSAQQNSQKEVERSTNIGALQNNASFASQIETNTTRQTDNNSPKIADLNESSVMKQQIFSGGSTKIETASIAVEKRDTDTLKNKLQTFLQKYCYTYESKQLDKFLTYFSIDAKENGKPLNTLIPKYRRNFAAIDTIEYSIILEKFTHDKISDRVRIEGKFKLKWQPHNSPWRKNAGKIFMELVKNDDSFKVLNLDYYGSSPSKK